MSSDAKTLRITASGAVFAGPGRVEGFHYLADATAGSITLRDGGDAGPIVAVFDTPGDATVANLISLDGSPLRCETSIYVAIANVTAVTVIYN